MKGKCSVCGKPVVIMIEGPHGSHYYGIEPCRECLKQIAIDACDRNAGMYITMTDIEVYTYYQA